ncbi:hypothetical protein [Haloferax volcanii]|uniref:hypothetical protein n=1 Tax=Haloferax volcanii TaxID=2246 RepID=UPI0023DC4585|nr:hypothetical protein [Haloferax lucentense]WEL24593.1 hypothetical protein SVXHx_0259 [Haloferax lucentense]
MSIETDHTPGEREIRRSTDGTHTVVLVENHGYQHLIPAIVLVDAPVKARGIVGDAG